MGSVEVAWGDGSFDVLGPGHTHANHQYAHDGTYYVTVDVSDSDGQYSLGPFQVRAAAIDAFTQAVPNPAPLYNTLMQALAKKKVKEYSDAHIINTIIRGQATQDRFLNGQITLSGTTALSPYGFDLGASQRWQIRETERFNRFGFDVTFNWQSYLHYTIIYGHVPSGATNPTGLVQYRFYVYLTTTTTNRATGVVNVTRRKVWQTGGNTGYDGTWANPNSLRLN